MDSGDKSMNKAMSAAFKYACFQVFCIPTEEMHDSEEDSPEPTKKKSQPQNNQQFPQQEFVNEAELNQQMAESVDPDLVPHGEGMTKKRIARLKKAQEITGKNNATILATAKAKSFEEITEANYIAVMNLFLKLMTPEQKEEISRI